MAKKGYNIGKMLKVSKEWYYEQLGNTHFFADKGGGVAVQTDNQTIMAELEAKGAVLTQKDGIKKIFDAALERTQQRDTFSLHRSDITFLYDCHSIGKKNPVTMFSDWEVEDGMKVAAVEYVDIFDPQFIVSGTAYRDPIVMICEDCYGLVMPVLMKNYSISNLKTDAGKLMRLFDRAI